VIIMETYENLEQDDLQKQSTRKYKVYKPRCDNCGSTTMIRKSLGLYLCIECGERTKGGV